MPNARLRGPITLVEKGRRGDGATLGRAGQPRASLSRCVSAKPVVSGNVEESKVVLIPVDSSGGSRREAPCSDSFRL
jgi:hypothetical protein